MADQLSLLPCLRWRSQTNAWRLAGEKIRPGLHGVEILPQASARAFVEEHHYSGTFPAAVLSVGLFRKEAPWSAAYLAGVAVFSVPVNQRTVPARLGLLPHEGFELGRLVLLDVVEGNGESWFVSRALQILRAEKGARGVLSYSDPVRRVTAAGEEIMPGHVGVVYQALNGRYVGRSRARRHVLDPRGRVLDGRLQSKLTRDEQGRDYAERTLREMGAPRRRPGESGAAYLERAIQEGPFRVIRHPGNHCYVWALGSSRKERRAVEEALPEGRPYPRLAEHGLEMA